MITAISTFRYDELTTLLPWSLQSRLSAMTYLPHSYHDHYHLDLLLRRTNHTPPVITTISTYCYDELTTLLPWSLQSRPVATTYVPYSYRDHFNLYLLLRYTYHTPTVIITISTCCYDVLINSSQHDWIWHPVMTRSPCSHHDCHNLDLLLWHPYHDCYNFDTLLPYIYYPYNITTAIPLL